MNPKWESWQDGFHLISITLENSCSCALNFFSILCRTDLILAKIYIFGNFHRQNLIFLQFSLRKSMKYLNPPDICKVFKVKSAFFQVQILFNLPLHSNLSSQFAYLIFIPFSLGTIIKKWDCHHHTFHFLGFLWTIFVYTIFLLLKIVEKQIKKNISKMMLLHLNWNIFLEHNLCSPFNDFDLWQSH